MTLLLCKRVSCKHVAAFAAADPQLYMHSWLCASLWATAAAPLFIPAGFPTGLGALIARKESLSVLHKVYFGGGSVLDATAEDAWRLLSPAPTGFEDGTRDFLGITQLQFGFKQLQQLGGIEVCGSKRQNLKRQQLRAGMHAWQ